MTRLNPPPVTIAALPLGQMLSAITSFSDPADECRVICVSKMHIAEIAMTAYLIAYPSDSDWNACDRAISENGYVSLGTIDIIQDIVSVARDQKSDATPEQLLASVIYYLEHDTFLVL